MDNKTGSNHGRKVVRKCKNSRETVGKIIKPRTPVFGTLCPSMDRKKVRKRPVFPTHCFLHFPWDLPTIFARGPIPKRPKKALFCPRSYSKGPNHALEKVLTNENTLYIHSAAATDFQLGPRWPTTVGHRGLQKKTGLNSTRRSPKKTRQYRRNPPQPATPNRYKSCSWK